jgi:uncharacterized membrane protein HdeD (DUF308 family)
MVAVSIILGIVSILGGIFCMTAPVNTYHNLMMFFAAMMLVYGVYGIIRFFKRKSLVPEFLISIVSVILGFIYLFRPGNTSPDGMLVLDRIVLFLTAAWFLIKGCMNVYYSVQTRFFNDRWVLGFISGLISAVLGIYSFIYPSTAAASIGILVGMWMIQCGIDFLVFGTTVGYIQKSVEDVEQEINKRVEETVSAVEKIQQEAAAAVEKARAEAAKEVKTIPVETVEEVKTAAAKTAEDVKTTAAKTAEDVKTTAAKTAEDVKTTVAETAEDLKTDK